MKSIIALPFQLLTAWLLLAGVYQTYQIQQGVAAKVEQAGRISEVAKNPLSLFGGK